MAFFPTRGVQETPASARQPFVDVRIPTDDGETLHAWWLEHPQPSAQVLFFHGNGGNLSMWLDVVVELRRRGFSVLAVDYRGYGDSTGRPTERGVYRDADATVRLFNERFRRAGSPVIYWGRSLGSAVAASAASRGASDALVLESPFPDTRAIFAGNPVTQVLTCSRRTGFPPRGSSNDTSGRCSSSTATPIRSSRTRPASACSTSRRPAERRWSRFRVPTTTICTW